MSKSVGAMRRYGGGGLNPNDIADERDMIVDRGNYTTEVDDVLTVSRDMLAEYGQDVPLRQFLISKMTGNGASVIGYYDGANIGINERYMNTAAIEKAYAECVKAGFHPSAGTKSALQAVAAHEFGHAANDAAAKKMGLSMDAAAAKIVSEAKRDTKHRGVVQLASKISTYATHSNAETIAEAVSDVYCNGSKAKAESHAVVNALNKYLK